MRAHVHRRRRVHGLGEVLLVMRVLNASVRGRMRMMMIVVVVMMVV